MYVNRIIKYIFEISNAHDSLFIFNGFTQNKIKSEFLIRPVNPIKFLKKIITFKNLEQDMTNGGYIFFKNKKSTNEAFKIIKNYKICGIKIFKISQKKDKSFFYRIIIKSKKNLNDLHFNKIDKSLLSQTIKDENVKYNFQINFNSKELSNFLNNIQFIKTTGVHIPTGDVLYKNIKKIANKKSIENHEIFNIFNNFF